MPLPPRLPQVLRAFCRPQWDLCTDGVRGGAPRGAEQNSILLIVDVTKQEFIIAYVGFNLQSGNIIDKWCLVDDCMGLNGETFPNILGFIMVSDNPLCYTVINYKRFKIPAEFTINIVPSTQAVGREARGAPEDQTVQAWHRNRWQKPRDFNSEDLEDLDYLGWNQP